MKTLIIAEKPKIACKIAAVGQKCLGQFQLPTSKIALTDNFFKHNEKRVVGEVCKSGKLENDKYIITYAAGHLIELFQAEDYNPEYKNWNKIPFPFVPDPFKFKILKESKDLFENIKKYMLSQQIKEIIVATDADREGQNIYALIEKMAGCTKPVKRLWADAFSEAQFEKAFKNIKDNHEYDHLRDAGYCRMISDWLMGGLLTGKATVVLGGYKNMINIGRVQTAVLAEIVRVELLNRNHKTRKYYVLKGTFQSTSGKTYEGICDLNEYDTAEDGKQAIQKLANPKTGKLDRYTRENVRRYSPPLYSQTSLQIMMAQSHGISPDDTLAASQNLYENGYATYPRTASECIASGEADDFETMLRNVKSINPLALKYPFDRSNKRIVNDSEVESHSAITPTIQVPNPDSLPSKARAVYEELVKRAISVTFPAAVDQEDEALTNVKGLIFKSTGKKELEKGWREVYNIAVKCNPLPLMKTGNEVKVLGIDLKEMETKPPKRHTEDSILSFMKNCGKKLKDNEKKQILKDRGIGTEATRSEILPKLKRAQYIEIKGRTIYPTDKGIDVIKTFPVEELKSPEYTADLELMLYQVENGQLSKDQYMKKIIQEYRNADSKIVCGKTQKISSGENSLGTCPLCGDTIREKKGTKGEFYGCSGYKTGCRFAIFKICGKLPTQAQVKKLLTGKKVIMKGLKKNDGKKLPDAYAMLNKDGKVELDFSAGFKHQNSSKGKNS